MSTHKRHVINFNLDDCIGHIPLAESTEYKKKIWAIIKAEIDERFEQLNPKLPEVPAPPSITDSPLAYSGHENREFQVW